MKVLLLLNKFPFGVADGGAAVSRALARDVLSIGYPTHILVPHTFKHPFIRGKIPDSCQPSRWLVLPCGTRLSVQGFIRSWWQKRSYHLWRYDRPHQAAEMLKVVKVLNPDVMVLEGMAGLAFLSVLRQTFPSLPLVYYAHNVEWRVWQGIEQGLTQLHPLKLVYRWIWQSLQREEEKNWTRATCLTGVSAGDVNYMAARTGKKLAAPIFPGLWEFLPPSLERSMRVGEPLKLYHLGAMDWAPNREGVVHFLRHVWPLVKRAIPHSELYLAGKNMPSSIKNLKMRDVHVVGYVENQEDFLRDKHVCVAPQLSGSGIRIKVLEAMAYGKPVVASPKGAEGLPVEAGRHFLLADTPEAFVTHLLRLTEDDRLRHNMVEEARALVALHFTRRHSELALRRILEEAVRG